MEDASVELMQVTGISAEQAQEYLKAVGGVLEDACFLHYCVSGVDPDMYPVFYGKPLTTSPKFTITMGNLKPVKAASAQDITQWEERSFESLPSPSEQCSICLCEFLPAESGDIVRLGKCRSHFFHKVCITPAFSESQSLKCPVCGVTYGVHIGPMPAGTLRLQEASRVQCEGYAPGSWVLSYKFPDGKLPDGTRYTGTKRQGVVPNTPEGQEVARLLVWAFYWRHTFAVGTSVTTGTTNTVVWNGIHHKTSVDGGPTCFGYPDPTYFSRVKTELATRGIVYRPAA